MASMKQIKKAARILRGGEFDIGCTGCNGNGCGSCGQAGHLVASWDPIRGLTASPPKRGGAQS